MVITRLVLVLGIMFSWSATTLAIDPDMQALVIDNGCPSGYSDSSNGQCVNVSSVPEPSGLILLITGVAVLTFLMYHRRKS